MIDLQDARQKLAANATVISGIAESVAPEQARWQPEPGKWSVVMVLAHLADEERDDFRSRLDLTLHHPGTAWPPNDPEAWARDRDYNSRDHRAVLADFLAERERSLAWLAALSDPQWRATYRHPSRDLTAGDLMVSWMAHDLLHIRQLVKLQFDWLRHTNMMFDTGYAGEW